MKILVVSEAFPSTERPFSGLFVLKLIDELFARGHEITVVSPRGPSNVRASKPESVSYNVSYPICPIHNGESLMLNRYSVSRAISVKVLQAVLAARHFRPDIIYAHFAFPSGYIAAALQRTLDIPLVISLGESRLVSHVGGWRGAAEGRRLKHILLAATRVAAVSQKLQREAIEVVGGHSSKIDYIPNGVDTKLFRPHDQIRARDVFGWPRNQLIAGYVGSMNSRKGSDVLSKLADALYPKVRFAFATGSAEMVHQAAVHQGPVPQSMLPLFLSACDCFVFPSRAEGMSNAILEALAVGLPVFASDTPFNREFLNADNSCLVDFSNTQEVARELLSRTETKQLGAITERAILTARKFDLGVRALRIEKILHEAIEHYRG